MNHFCLSPWPRTYFWKKGTPIGTTRIIIGLEAGVYWGQLYSPGHSLVDIFFHSKNLGNTIRHLIKWGSELLPTVNTDTWIIHTLCTHGTLGGKKDKPHPRHQLLVGWNLQGCSVPKHPPTQVWVWKSPIRDSFLWGEALPLQTSSFKT